MQNNPEQNNPEQNNPEQQPGNFRSHAFEGGDWRKAEALVLTWLRGRYETVVDLRGDEWARKMDVDFQAIMTSGRYWFYDVKAESNTQRTGNIAFEIVSNFGTGTPGAHLMSSAHFIAHVSTGSEWFLRIIDLKRLREWINKNGLRRFQCVPCGTKMNDGTFAYTTLSLLLPLFEVEPFLKWSGPLRDTEANK